MARYNTETLFLAIPESRVWTSSCYNFDTGLQTSGRDHIHLPPNFDTDKPVRKWFIIDLNVNSCLSRDEVKELPHQAYAVSRQDNRW